LLGGGDKKGRGKDMEYVLPNSHADSFAIVSSRISETARHAFETLVWSEGISEGSKLDDSVANAVYLAVADFLGNPAVSSIIDMHGLPPEFVGHNLVLSGNRHGAGFWDAPPSRDTLRDVTQEQLQTLHNYSIPIEVYADDDGTYYAL